MLKILLNTIVVILVVLLSPFKIKAQQVMHDNIITLSNPDQGNKVYMADERVEFLPGYEFDANSSDKMEAFIEKSMSYTDLYTTNDFNSLQLDVNKDIGSMPGQFDVMGSGAASYVFPIELPKGVNGFQPNLSLGYNSFNSNDILGMGWNLNGLSIIKVSKQQLFRDGESRGVLLDGTDMFELDNTRLYAENGDYGSDGTTYSTEVYNFSRITSHGNGVTPNYFTLETKDGIIIEYGKSKNSFIDNDNQTKIIYGINKMIDQNGNLIEFLYENVAGEIRIKEIKYGGHSSGITDQIIRIKFNYQQRQDINTLYHAGASIVKNSLLKEITINKSNQSVYSYDFEYGYNSASYLKKITKKSSNNELNPIHFKYGKPSTHFPLESSLTFQNKNPNTDYYAGGDYNGDGLQDLFAKEYYYQGNQKIYDKWIIYTSNGDNTFEKFIEQPIQIDQQIYGYQYTLNISRQTQHNHDFTGNGRTDLITYQVFGDEENGYAINNLTVYEFNENGTISSTENIEIGNSTQNFFNPEKGLHIGDFTGNGLSDIIVMSYNESDMIYHGLLINFELSGYELSFLNLDGLEYLNAAHDISLGDFNGDGKTDISVLYNNSLQVFDFEGSTTFNENKIAHIINPFPNDFSNHSECKLQSADFNGDGNTDYLIYKEYDDALIALSDGISNLTDLQPFTFQGSPTPSNTGGSGLHNIWQSGLRVVDVNKNGKSDIVHFYRDHNAVPIEFNIDVYLSNGYSYDMTRIQNQFLSGAPLSSIPFMDFNGDGFPSLFNHNKSQGVSYIRSFNLKNSKHNLLTNIKDEFLNEIQINYEFLPQDEDYNHMNNPPNSTGYVLRDFVPTIPIVKSVLSPSSTGLLDNEVKYKYRGGKAGFRGVGFLGFMENETIDAANEKKQVSEKTILRSSSQTAHPNLFVPFEFKKTVLDFDNEIITEKISTPNLTVFSGLRYDLEITNTTDTDYLNDTELVKHYLYDNSRNLTKEVSLLYSNNSLVQTVTSEFNYDHFGTTLGFNNKLTQQKVTVSKPNVQDDFTTIETFDYHSGNGNLTKKKSQVNTPFEVTEEYNYNFFGNMIKTTTKTVGFEDRVSRTVYDFNGRLPIKTINELGQEATIQYHPLFDKPVQITDADGLISTSTYDSFGRLTSTVDKYGIVSTIQKEWVNTNPSVTSGNPTQADDIMYKVIESRQGEPDKTVHYNRLGQQRMQEIQGLTDPIFSITTYNNKGQVVASTEPFFQGASNISLSETVYDDYNRVSNVTSNGETVSYSYDVESGLQKTTTTNPDGTTHTAYEDASGNLIKSEDNGGLIEYSYFSHGGVKEIKVHNEIAATSEYDVLGRQTKLIDVNAGTVEYEYNAFGDVIETINANGEIKTYTYDDYGRLEQTNNNGIIVNYEYVETGNGINEIEKISTNDHEELFEYDGLNRVVKTTEIINGNSFEFEYVYNSLSQAEQIIYPNGLVVNNIYDNNGYLIEVKDENNNSLWQGLAQDALGRFVEYKKGDNVTTELFYDAFQNLAEIDAGNVQHHVYNWNSETGNLSYRKDLVKQLEEDFEYDNLNRLTKATASPIGSGLVLNSLEMDYAPNGNIIDKSDVGDYAYHPTKPNAVTHVTNENENISTLTQDITYNALNKASLINEGDGAYTLEFLYGHDKQRRKTTFYENSDPVLEKYFVGLYEKEFEPQTGITRHINYITAGDGMTAIVLQEEESGDVLPDETYFTYKDHLGSIVALTDETGDVVLEQSFDAWGRYRNPNDWSYNILNPSPTWLRGYTGHEHLPHFDLINMNGRIYDPILGRMLSPDRFVPDPLSSQGYNRYSYVLNNPLRYSDPSGDLPVVAIAVGFAVGAYIGGATVNNTFAAWDWDFNDKNTWIGMGIGGIVGGLAGWSVGASMAASKATAAAQGVAGAKKSAGMANFFSGSLNAMYSYDSDQGLGLHTLAHFGAGFIGGHLANSLGLLPGLLVGGSANVAAHVGSYDEDGDPIGYQAAQKFVGGALTTYAGASFYNSKLSYMGMKNKQIGKGLTYMTQAYGQSFAYSSKKAFTGMSPIQHIMTGVIGFSVGVANYNIGQINHEFEKIKNKNLETIINRTWQSSVAFGVGFADYRLHMGNQQYYQPNEYKGHNQKYRIYSVKSLFNNLFIQ